MFLRWCRDFGTIFGPRRTAIDIRSPDFRSIMVEITVSFAPSLILLLLVVVLLEMMLMLEMMRMMVGATSVF